MIIEVECEVIDRESETSVNKISVLVNVGNHHSPYGKAEELALSELQIKYIKKRYEISIYNTTEQLNKIGSVFYIDPAD